MNSGCDSLKNRPPATRLATMYTNQAYLPKEVCPVKIMSINRVHEVFGHFFSSVFDKNEYTHKNIAVSLAKVYLFKASLSKPFLFYFPCRHRIPRIIRPGMLRIPSLQLLLHLLIPAVPESAEILRHLHRPVRRRKKM